jgi:hypothetical protein
MNMHNVLNEFKRQYLGEDLVITSLADALQLHEKFIKIRMALMLKCGFDIMPHYRGEQQFGWDIEPGIFRNRNDLDGQTAKKLEQEAIKLFEKKMTGRYGEKTLKTFFNNRIYGREWGLLFQAQHAGIKTTLTDWTAAILIALYFATELHQEDNDGQLWCLLLPTQNLLIQESQNDPRSLFNINPFDVKRIHLINPTISLDGIDNRIFEKRMSNQGGRFLTLPSKICNIPINKYIEVKEYIIRITIP